MHNRKAISTSWGPPELSPEPRYKHKLSNEKVHCRKDSATRALKCRQFQRKCNNAIFRGPTVFANDKTHLGPTLEFEHMQSRCMPGSAKKPSFLASFGSWACARLLVRVSCPLNNIWEHKLSKGLSREKVATVMGLWRPHLETATKQKGKIML